MIRLNLSLIYLMVPFATLLVGAAACLVCETLGAPRRYDPVLCAMIGLTACLIFLAGHVAPVPAFLAVAPLIAGFYGQPAAGVLLAATSVNMVVGSATSQHYAILARRMEFGWTAVIDSVDGDLTIRGLALIHARHARLVGQKQG